MPLICNGIKPKTDDKSNGLRKPALIFLRIFQLYMIFQLRIKEKIWGLSTAPSWSEVAKIRILCFFSFPPNWRKVGLSILLLLFFTFRHFVGK